MQLPVKSWLDCHQDRSFNETGVSDFISAWMVNDDFWWKSMVLEGWNQIASCSTEALDQHDLELTKHLTICCIDPIGVNVKSRKLALSIQTGL